MQMQTLENAKRTELAHFIIHLMSRASKILSISLEWRTHLHIDRVAGFNADIWILNVFF